MHVARWVSLDFGWSEKWVAGRLESTSHAINVVTCSVTITLEG